MTTTCPEGLHPLSECNSVPACDNVTLNGEVRTTSRTGGEKGVKPARFDLIPIGPLTKVAELYGKGAEKYADHNWRNGYEWSKSYAALMRHATQFWNGENNDTETGLPHMTSVIFHAMALLEFAERFPDFDDRYVRPLDEPDAIVLESIRQTKADVRADLQREWV